MIIILPKFGPLPSGFMEVDTTSHGSFKDLSPFYLGPIEWDDPQLGHLRCLRMENLWQYSKLYPLHAGVIAGGDLLDPSAYYPSEEFYKWQLKGFASSHAERYPMGKQAKPICSIWCGNKYDYVSARKKIYIPAYAAWVAQTRSYEMLANWVKEGYDIALRDFDGYNNDVLGLSLKDVVNNPKKSMGHAFVLKMLLDGVLEEVLN